MKLNLKKLRLENHLSQVELARIIDVDPRNISKYENEETTPPVEVLIKIADTFSVSLDYLVKRENSNSWESIEIAGEVVKPHELNHLITYRKLGRKAQKNLDALMNGANWGGNE